MELLRKTLEERGNKQEEELTPGIIGGDLNVTSWMSLYREWVQTEGMIELVNPCIPTYATGSAINKILFAPGGYMPSTFLPTKGAEWTYREARTDDQYFPASVINCTHISDHLPIILPIPCDKEEK